MPRVSIGLTVFNGERYLEESLRSLLDQTFDDFELIVSDNASNDRTEEIARTYVEMDARVKYVRNSVNIGVAGNFNQAFHLSSGEFFKWAAHDDLCGPDLLLRSVEILDRDPGVVLASPRTVLIDEHGEVIALRKPGADLTSEHPAVRFARIMRTPFWATALFGVIRTDVMSKTGLMPRNIAADHVLLAELALRGRFVEIPEESFFNRDHPGRVFTKSSIVRRAQQVDPHLSSSPLRLRLDLIGSYLSAIKRTPLDSWTRLRCCSSVARWLGSRIVARVIGRHPVPPEADGVTRHPRG